MSILLIVTSFATAKGCETEWYCVKMDDGHYNVVRLKNSVVVCMGHPARTKSGPKSISECYWNAPCKDGKPTVDTGYSWTVDELCKNYNSCNAAGKDKCVGWCATARGYLAGKGCGKCTPGNPRHNYSTLRGQG